MSQCLRITFFFEGNKKILHSIIQKEAKRLSIEGIAQSLNSGASQIKVLACGNRDAINEFVDMLHKEVAKDHIKDIEIEPFIKERDYRGVFRVIE